MTNDLTTEAIGHRLVLTRELNAPRELAWTAWTDPAHIKQWLQLGEGMTTESVRADVRPGGKFRIQQRRADGEYFTAVGTYLEVTPPERLVYTFDWEKDGAGTEFGELDGNETQVTVEFRAVGERTELVFTHEKFATAERRDRHEGGWTEWLAKFAEFLERK